jgi:asparagine synthetase B (glutamine-hydrolysing)
MCTFKITNDPNPLLVDKYLKLGGPTLSNTLELNGVYYTHHLLNITGSITTQPVKNKNKYFILIGEIYNYDKSYPSDIYQVIDAYEKYKNNLTNYLDGEFLIIIFDEFQIDIFTDPWSTRQCWFFKKNNYFYFSTFPIEDISNRVNIRPHYYGDNNLTRLKPNTHYNFIIDNQILTIINNELHKWDFSQYKNTLNDWFKAFDEAVLKRSHKDQIVCFSGGLDSSCLVLSLTDQKIKFDSMMLKFNDVEDENTINSVIDYCKDYMNLLTICDKVSIDNIDKFEEIGLINKAIVQIAQIAKNLNKKVVLQGNGADEIISNYMQKSNQPINTKTFWKEDLESIFPYSNFYDGQMRRIIDSFEFAFLMNGIELRNVFLDKKLTQEWFNLSSNLKNKSVKLPLKGYLYYRNIPLPNVIVRLTAQDY